MFKFSALAIAAVATFGISGPASAKPDQAVIAVDISDLDLVSTKDQQRMDVRIDSAIRKLCDSRGIQSTQMRAASAQCTNEALASVKPQTDRAIALAMGATRTASLEIRTAS